VRSGRGITKVRKGGGGDVVWEQIFPCSLWIAHARVVFLTATAACARAQSV